MKCMDFVMKNKLQKLGMNFIILNFLHMSLLHICIIIVLNKEIKRTLYCLLYTYDVCVEGG